MSLGIAITSTGEFDTPQSGVLIEKNFCIFPVEQGIFEYVEGSPSRSDMRRGSSGCLGSFERGDQLPSRWIRELGKLDIGATLTATKKGGNPGSRHPDQIASQPISGALSCLSP